MGGINSKNYGTSETDRQQSLLETFLRGQQAQQIEGMKDSNQYANQSALSAQQAQQQQEAQDTALSQAQDLANNNKGMDVSTGGGKTMINPNPLARMQGLGPQQAKAFNAAADKVYKPINDQIDASKATLDALNQNNAASDKLALINEARLAAGMGGSRAIKGIMDTLSGGKTANMQFQEAMNYVNNTNLPEMPPAQRNALREAVFNRLPQLQTMHQQAASKLAQQGPILAPNADFGSLAKSYTAPAETNLATLSKMQQDYQSQRQGQPQVSNPQEANANPSNMDKLKSFLGFGGQAQGGRGGGRTLIKQQRNSSTGQVRNVYSDGSTEIVNGQ